MPAGHITTQLAGVANLALMASVRTGFVEGFETITYAARLDALLKTLNGLRKAARERLLEPSPFPDSVGRFKIIQSFRYAIVPPDAPALRPDNESARTALPVAHRLSLNVGFDGGWEPYLRVIYRDLGPLLDAIFCHCDGYPSSTLHSMDDYIRWVRAHEIEGGIHYTESALSAVDQRYLAQVEKIQRESTDLENADGTIAGLSLPDGSVVPVAGSAGSHGVSPVAIDQGLRALRALHALRPLFAANAERDDAVLLRLAQYALREFHALVVGGLFDGAALSEALQRTRQQYGREIAWFRSTPGGPRPAAPRALEFEASAIQAGILGKDRAITHGCLVLFHIRDAARARAFLGATELICAEGDAGTEQRYGNLALSFNGLRALGVPEARLADWPQEFIDGMESRAGLLGDLHGNHPDHWLRPLRNWQDGKLVDTLQRVELSSVHGLIQLRIADADNVGHGLHPTLAGRIAELDDADSGLMVLSVQPMRRLPLAGGEVVEHFGFRDGLSQPRVFEAPSVPAPAAWDDSVRRGEILLGYPGDRDHRPFPAEPDRLLDNGCFLVVRKLAQHVGRLDRVLEKQARALAEAGGGDVQALKIGLKEGLMGRRLDGTPLVAAAASGRNDFNYEADPQGRHCPFHSHVRRANPRGPLQQRDAQGRLADAQRAVPRLLRRGMSYGPPWSGGPDDAAERGMVFMAYAASLAEQFEVIQRWISGGNSSGVLSRHNDPLLGVPMPGETARVYRSLGPDGKVVRVDLGTEAFTQLHWGLYLFVPGIDALRHLDAVLAEPPPAAGAANPPPMSDAAAPRDKPAGTDRSFKTWQRRLGDETLREAAWREVRQQRGGVLHTDYGELVGRHKPALAVLADDGRRYSVCGYDTRFKDSIGAGYLGLDAYAEHAVQAPKINAAIESISADKAYRATRAVADLLRPKLRAFTQRNEGTGERETPIDIVVLSENVLAALCQEWFGLPDAAGQHMQAGARPLDPGVLPVRCPGHFVSVSRLLFGPHPSPTVQRDGERHGGEIHAAVRAFLAAPGAVKGPLVLAIEDALAPQHGPGESCEVHAERVASTVAGVMLGFAPTVHGNFCALLRAWIENRSLWDLQLGAPLAARGVAGHSLSHDQAVALWAAPMFAQMRAAPIPSMLWRTRVDAPAGALSVEPAPPVVVGLASAIRDRLGDSADGGPVPTQARIEAANALLFGGARQGKDMTPHACPGRPMATGVMLGLLAWLMQLGTLRPTGSPTTLMLVEPAPP